MERNFFLTIIRNYEQKCSQVEVFRWNKPSKLVPKILMMGPETAILKVQPPLLQECSGDLMCRIPLFPLLCFWRDITQVTIPTK